MNTSRENPLSTHEMLLQAKATASSAPLSTQAKNAALEAMAAALLEEEDSILKANAADMEAARGRISEVMLDRLALDHQRLEGMARGIRQVAALPDPVGRVLASHTTDNGLQVEKISIPMGVVAIIYESRPNVTSDAAALALKSGNVCVLRSGRDAWGSANAIVEALRLGLERAGLSRFYLNLVQDTSHASANELMTAVGLVDLLIPRGGADPGLCGKRHRALHRDRHRHLPCVCGRGRRPGYGPFHH